MGMATSCLHSRYITILYYILFYYIILYYITLHYVMLCYVMLCYVMLYSRHFMTTGEEGQRMASDRQGPCLDRGDAVGATGPLTLQNQEMG